MDIFFILSLRAHTNYVPIATLEQLSIVINLDVLDVL